MAGIGNHRPIGEGSQPRDAQIDPRYRAGVWGHCLLLFHLDTHIPNLWFCCPACSLTVAESTLTPSVGRDARSLSRRRPKRGRTIACSDTTILPVSRKLPKPFFLVLTGGTRASPSICLAF
jgi:hypothetical protein